MHTWRFFFSIYSTPSAKYLLNIAINVLHFSLPVNAKQCKSRAVLITDIVNRATHSEPAKSKLWWGPHLINSGIIIIFKNCIVYLENLPQSLNKLVWKPPGGLTSEILPQIAITSAQMSRVTDICISHTQPLLLIAFPVIWLRLCSVFSNWVTKRSTRQGQPCPGARGAPRHRV